MKWVAFVGTAFFLILGIPSVGVSFHITFQKSQLKVSLAEALSMVLQFQCHWVSSGGWGKAGILPYHTHTHTFSPNYFVSLSFVGFSWMGAREIKVQLTCEGYSQQPGGEKNENVWIMQNLTYSLETSVLVFQLELTAHLANWDWENMLNERTYTNIMKDHAYFLTIKMTCVFIFI